MGIAWNWRSIPHIHIPWSLNHGIYDFFILYVSQFWMTRWFQSLYVCGFCIYSLCLGRPVLGPTGGSPSIGSRQNWSSVWILNSTTLPEWNLMRLGTHICRSWQNITCCSYQSSWNEKTWWMFNDVHRFKNSQTWHFVCNWTYPRCWKMWLLHTFADFALWKCQEITLPAVGVYWALITVTGLTHIWIEQF